MYEHITIYSIQQVNLRGAVSERDSGTALLLTLLPGGQYDSIATSNLLYCRMRVKF